MLVDIICYVFLFLGNEQLIYYELMEFTSERFYPLDAPPNPSPNYSKIQLPMSSSLRMTLLGDQVPTQNSASSGSMI